MWYSSGREYEAWRKGIDMMKLITADTIEGLIDRASASERRRANHNVHESAEDPVQRLFVAAERDSYFRPHRHDGKSEFAMVLRGRFDVLVFDEAACVTERRSVGPGTDVVGFELEPDAWHAWVPIEDDSVFFEVKLGPYDPDTAAEFAEWAPAENTPEARAFAEKLRSAGVGESLAIC
jgi:cupin fold WbuC family metalloprotein